MKKKEQKQEKDEISLEELIEEQRAKLGTNLTKITLETFTTWKKRKVGVAGLTVKNSCLIACTGSLFQTLLVI